MKNLKYLLLLTSFLLLFSEKGYSGDGYLTNVSLNSYIETGTTYKISCNVRNHSSNSKITSFKLAWKIVEEGTVYRTQTINISGGIGTNNYVSYDHPAPLKRESSGDFTVKIWVEAEGETNPDNDTVTVESTALENAVDKKALFEVYTATWCQYCPDGNKVANKMASNPDVVIAKFHNNDELSIQAGENYYEAYYSGGGTFTPGGMLDMGKFGDYEVNAAHSLWEDQITAATTGKTPVALTLNTDFDQSSRALDVNLTANFNHPEQGDYYFNAYILESGIDKPQENASSNYEHDFVVREMLGGSNGTSNEIPENPTVSTDYNHSYSSTLPSSWDEEEITVVGIIFKKEAGETWAANAEKQNLSTENTRIREVEKNTNIKAYPNPLQDHLTVKLSESNPLKVALYSIEGKQVYAKDFESKNNMNEFTLDLKDKALPAGTYTLKVQTTNTTYTKQLVK